MLCSLDTNSDFVASEADLSSMENDVNRLKAIIASQREKLSKES